jgi:hypothetical protein
VLIVVIVFAPGHAGVLIGAILCLAGLLRPELGQLCVHGGAAAIGQVIEPCSAGHAKAGTTNIGSRLCLGFWSE